jgi:hypothetical protein
MPTFIAKKHKKCNEKIQPKGILKTKSIEQGNGRC